MNKGSGNSRIHATRKSANDSTFSADDITDLFDLFFNKLFWCPVTFAAANIEEEISQHLFSERRVRDLRMKLNAIDPALVRLDRTYHLAGGRGLVKSCRDLGYMIAMAHPNIELEW